jgi:hypothetical protein
MYRDDFLESLVSKHCKKGVLIDSNLLLLFLVATFDTSLIDQVKRLNTYSAKDCDFLLRFCSLFERVLTTPHILTEVSNLVQNRESRRRESRRLSAFLEHVAKQFKIFIERYSISSDVVDHFLFIPLGLADSALAIESDNGALVLTDDLSLCAALQNRGLDAINFNHLRQAYLLS